MKKLVIYTMWLKEDDFVLDEETEIEYVTVKDVERREISRLRELEEEVSKKELDDVLLITLDKVENGQRIKDWDCTMTAYNNKAMYDILGPRLRDWV